MPNTQYTIAQIKQILNAGGETVHPAIVDNLLTDSRKISNPATSLFFALTGMRDGHTFIQSVYNAGVCNFVVRHYPANAGAMEDANFLLVADVLEALQVLAAYNRSLFNIDVIGITGSNGKTTVKEWLYQLMSADKKIVRNPKSYNSQIGVPLSVWHISEGYDLGIFEAGISTVDEMAHLRAIINPTIGVLTHLGTAHDEGFKDQEEKLKEKLQLFTGCRLVIYNHDALLTYNVKVPGQEHFTWSQKTHAADLFIYKGMVSSDKYYLHALYKGTEIQCLIPFIDEASVENACTCWATLLALGYDAAAIGYRMERLTPVSMRMELKAGNNNCSIIDDSYNSDIQSLEIALNFLNQQNQHATRTLIMSDIYQSGLQPDVLYKQVADLVADKKVNKFIGVGKTLSAYRDDFRIPEMHFFDDTDSLLLNLLQLGLMNETILIKGSRSFEFERVSRMLVQKSHETVLEINLNAVQNNLNYYKAKLAPGVKIMAMVKAFSYGSGTYEIANLLQFNNVEYLAVAYIDEGVALRSAGIILPIMVLNTEPSAFDKMVEFKLEPEIYSFAMLNHFIEFAQQKKITAYPIHIKIDTGMRRLGFEDFEVEPLCDLLSKNRFVHVRSVFSHLAASDSMIHDDFTQQQLTAFISAYQLIEKTLGYRVDKHIANTSAISRWPTAQMDMVRLGIGLYGIDSSLKNEINLLQPVAKLKTSIAQVKRTLTGQTVGYNRSGVLMKDGKIATVRIGYADGYLRAFGNGVGKMLVKGVFVPTIGNISMDMTMIDVSDIEAEEGDEVIIFNDYYKIEELARQINTIPYEILTNVSQRVKRVYFYE